MHRSFVWNFSGVLVYNFSQLLILAAIARLLSAEAVGHYALALAITAPVYLTIGLNLRLIRTTDARDRWSWTTYTHLRLILNIASFLVAMTIGTLFRLDDEQFLTLALVAVSKGFEASSQLIYGQYQFAERMDLVARSLILRGVLGVGLLVGVLSTTQSLPLAVAGQTVAWVTVYAAHDRPLAHSRTDLPHRDDRVDARQVLALARYSAPLGLDAGVGSFAITIPRYVVQLVLGPTALGIFATLAYLAQLVSLTTGALGDAVLARLARLHATEDKRSFWGTMIIVVAFGWIVTALALAAAVMFGAQWVTLALGAEFVNQQVLIILLIGAGFTTCQRSLARAFYASQRYALVAFVNSIVLLASILIALTAIPRWGLTGAALTQGSAFVIGTLITMWLLFFHQGHKESSP
ncbi:lipopolysaccharide biosynthesis protein [Ornithinimicrobium cavernae]|uniref:lipopolysaccharide biosynthesis protein n=1 Tax=Ornithinimicrobium cavernae TaxID=2666047 RepID=UPI000D68DB5C|nr:oligosaccharide flippase family protein [Ornithinimicrobium cavernae]